ncbi:bifunctional diguanylate cyclase/phosphodiesterase [Shewanella sp. KJ2020]|uniref:putative bifunctional diguanylate cyclase/phosphodiesterase n=1 Tax=Shewanella sp. KJ2020 TaxID=2919172 RepID=UPI0020A6F43F|nr:EAL domain-containing protein [Shewanella sp. KJ2020]MCP3129620.1 EAL domain-containing protein [Shewanella sp. KJ2020]
MHIGKKILVFIAGFCLPAVVIVSYCLGYWYDHRVELLRQDSANRELTNIQQQFQIDVDRLAFLTNIYALPLSQLYGSQLSTLESTLESSWHSSSMSANLSWYILAGGELRAFLPNKQPLASDKLQEIANAVTAIGKPSVAGAYLIGNQAFVVTAVTSGPKEYVLLIRQLTPNDLLEYAQASLVTKVTMSHSAVAASNTEGTHSDIIEIPGLLKNEPIYLQVFFSDGLFQAVKFRLDWVSLSFILLGVFIVALGYIWLRRGLLKPFKHLMQQLALVDPMSSVYRPVMAEGNQELEVLASHVNSLLARIFQQKERAKITLESIAEAVILTDVDAKVLYMNAKAESLLGVVSADALTLSLGSLLKASESLNQAVFNCIRLGDSTPQTEKIKLLTASPRIMERSISNVRGHNRDIVGTVVVLRDITQEELLKRQLQRRANIDSVTQLLNRQAFEERLPHFAHNAKTIAVCYLDLEQFKLINDSCGHAAGDRMLAMVAKAMQACLGPGELLARLGGDEFGLVMCNRTALSVAQLLKQVSARVSLQVLNDKNCHYKVGLSIGVAFGRAPFIDAQELLKDADIACIAAKAKGSNQIHFYDDKDKELTYQRNAPKWAVRIAQAIEDNELILYYQPIRGLGAGPKRQRMEILLRIQEPCGRILAPAQFIAAAERFKLMPEIDKEVIRKAFLWLSLHPDLWPDHCISINLSGNSLGAEGMVEYIAQQQGIFDIPSQCICFEITETTAIQNRHRGMEMLKQLRKLGFSFALDDFGSGFASYGYLRELPVDYVKIDGCFVKNLAVNAKDYAIVKSIQDVCRVMGIETVAEFVENQDIIDCLQSIGINYAQGYAIGRPQPLANYREQYGIDIAQRA